MSLYTRFQKLGLQDIGVAHQCVNVMFVAAAFFVAHRQQVEPLAGFLQARRRCLRTDVLILQIVHPLLQVVVYDGFVELVDTDDKILWKHVLWRHHFQLVTLMVGQLQRVAVVNATKLHLSVVQVVGTLTQVKIQDIDAENLFHMLVCLAAAHVVGDGLCHAVEHTLQVVTFPGLLNFHQDNLSL